MKTRPSLGLLRTQEPRRDVVKCAGEAVEILEAFDLTGSLRAASELADCSPNTVARHLPVANRHVVRPKTNQTPMARGHHHG
jgi:hypothetical protein